MRSKGREAREEDSDGVKGRELQVEKLSYRSRVVSREVKLSGEMMKPRDGPLTALLPCGKVNISSIMSPL